MENGVPVVIAVDEDGVRIRDRAKRIEAPITMHDKRIRVISLHLLDVKRRPGVDYCRTAPCSSAQRTRSCVWLPAAAPTSTIVSGLRPKAVAQQLRSRIGARETQSGLPSKTKGRVFIAAPSSDIRA